MFLLRLKGYFHSVRKYVSTFFFESRSDYISYIKEEYSLSGKHLNNIREYLLEFLEAEPNVIEVIRLPDYIIDVLYSEVYRTEFYFDRLFNFITSENVSVAQRDRIIAGIGKILFSIYSVYGRIELAEKYVEFIESDPHVEFNRYNAFRHYINALYLLRKYYRKYGREYNIDMEKVYSLTEKYTIDARNVDKFVIDIKKDREKNDLLICVLKPFYGDLAEEIFNRDKNTIIIRKKKRLFYNYLGDKSYFRKISAKYVDYSPHAHAYIKGRSVKTAMEPHKNARYILHIDIHRFFESITKEMLVERLGMSEKDALRLTYDGVLRLGLPHSPELSNAVAIHVDERIISLINEKYQLFDIVYTRYSDDMIFSSASTRFFDYREFIGDIEKILKSLGFSLNKEKTRFITGKYKMKSLGITLNPKKLSISKKERKRVRAMIHKAIRIENGEGDYNQTEKKHFTDMVKGKIAWIYSVNKKQGEKLMAMFTEGVRNG